jgi:RNA polymerase sigma-70 factor (ECF subfamily)
VIACNDPVRRTHFSDVSTFADRDTAERRFDEIFVSFDLVRAYARRRGAADPEATAAEVMTIAWRRLPDVPRGNPRPWLLTTARNLVFAEWHRAQREPNAFARVGNAEAAFESPTPVLDLDPTLEAALRSLSIEDREMLLLIAWEELAPREVGQSMGISPVALRVRLHRARRRLQAALTRVDAGGTSRRPIPRSTNG